MIMATLYTHSIRNPPQNTMVVFKMHDSLLSARYPPICNVLRQWKTSLTPIYRVYQSDDVQHFLESRGYIEEALKIGSAVDTLTALKFLLSQQTTV